MNRYLITKGSGYSKYAENAFDNALSASGIADFNLVKLSSILPAGCQRVDSVDLPKGFFLHTAFSRCIVNQPSITISASIAIAIPSDKTLSGVIMEASGEYDIRTADDIVCSMARISMESRGITEYEIQKESISMTTKDGFNCVIAAVPIW
jgi:arginine decarboxylase